MGPRGTKDVSGWSLGDRVSGSGIWEPEREAAKDSGAHGFSDVEENSIPS